MQKIACRDGTSEDFKTIRGSIVWPHEETPGMILIGGLKYDDERIKVLEESEFRNLAEAAEILTRCKERYFNLYCFYYPDIPESEAAIKYINKRNGCLFILSPYSENIDFGIRLIAAYIDDNKLIVPKKGYLATQLKMNWDVGSGKRLYAVICLACFLCGMENFYDGDQGKDGTLFSEEMLKGVSV